MDINERFQIIKRNTEDIMTEDDLRKLLQEKERISAYYGTAPTGPFHMGYLVPLGKIFDFERAGIKTKILIADIHAALDDLKTPWADIGTRAEFYKKCIELAFPWNETPEIVLGTEFQLGHDYMLDMLKLSTLTTVVRATRAASEVTRMKTPKVSELVYPLMQSLDEVYLDVDIQLGGIDQRHILAYARDFLPKIGHEPRVEVMTPLVASLKGPGTKMSASDPASHIKVYDSEEQIREKIKKAYCPVGETTENPLLQLCKFVVLPIKRQLAIERPENLGGDKLYQDYETLENEFRAKALHPADLKPAVAEALVDIFVKVRKHFESHRDELEELGKEFLP